MVANHRSCRWPRRETSRGRKTAPGGLWRVPAAVAAPRAIRTAGGTDRAGALVAGWRLETFWVKPSPGKPAGCTPRGGDAGGPGLLAAAVRRDRGLRVGVPGHGPGPRERPDGH